MEEIGSRATIFELEGLGSEKRTYIKWVLTQSTAPKTKIEGIITEDALATLSRSIIEAHGDGLWATANVPNGAVFQFMVSIPITAVESESH